MQMGPGKNTIGSIILGFDVHRVTQGETKATKLC